MKTLCTLFISGCLLLTLSLSVSAQWMGGGRGQTGWWGGGMCRMMDVSPQPVAPASLLEPNSLGAQLLKNQCTQCHGLVAPGKHAAQDWPAIVDRMDRRMQMMAQGNMGMMRHSIELLTSAEKQALLGYLGKHSFLAADSKSLADEQGTTVDAYINVCSRCHALPDPTAHNAKEWATVVTRMTNNMMNLGMEPMTAEQRKEILTYLQDQMHN
jgi:cytochrome c5